MSNEMMNREVQEAISAGERALRSLRAAQGKLDSAKNWGIFDMLGGGFIASLVKHTKMNEATADMDDAKYALKTFQRELRDIQVPMDMKMDVGEFLSFADYFFDGFVADYLVQSKISEARAQVDSAINMVENILSELRRR